ncbi:hypothetical protein SPRG_11226 [Saprolegnia parasitica CBS 223.65]|uniref:SUEL-type lectin domain-containing protein n=1 Tax=Saprolegnia parasitica (strain CBS 223.65) TaxID=695850 RepID=A0A067CAG5_SAPPC|nr:hypothetical protein SPRG_11226 [Saprolegnia parasitica CBS 223.65]KDO23797.1 hypothetical protein SPRG_11226 [Saprolegnia parasitica CBS 223.65]|eukprot:XP_012205433.1 hypothetical protein SPRG_11226 [Saprolegnia parasitica CBS 223.65]
MQLWHALVVAIAATDATQCPANMQPVSVLGLAEVQCVASTPCSGIYAAAGTPVGSCPVGTFCSVFPDNELVMVMRCATDGYPGAISLNADGSMRRPTTSAPGTTPPSTVSPSAIPTPLPSPSTPRATTLSPNATTFAPNSNRSTAPPLTEPILVTPEPSSIVIPGQPTTAPNSANQSAETPATDSAGIGASAIIGICIGAVALVAIAIGVRVVHGQKEPMAESTVEAADGYTLTPRRHVVLL